MKDEPRELRELREAGWACLMEMEWYRLMNDEQVPGHEELREALDILYEMYSEAMGALPEQRH